MPQLRQNIITGEWVVIAPERAKRPVEYVSASQPKEPASPDCPFCVHNKVYKNERLHGYETDDVYVIPNKFPAFIEDPKICPPRSFKVEDDFFLAKPAIGGHDVVVVKDHDMNLAEFSVGVWRDLLTIIRKRYQHYAKLCNGEYTMAIYNEKQAGGASMVHPHAQIFTSDIIPNLISREISTTSSYWDNNGTSAFEGLVNHEKSFKQRLIYENDYYLAFTQFAAKYPFEIWVMPKFQESHFQKISPTQLAALVPTMRNVFGKLNKSLNNPPLNFFIHSAPNHLEDLPSYRWHIEIVPRFSTFGGYELGSGVIIDIISPEIAAAFLNGKQLHFD
jgi:UDPglucose--hexose-1-phosphate uridylyltransferase